MQIDKPLKILMLEDNHDDVLLIERSLRKDGFIFESRTVDTRVQVPPGPRHGRRVGELLHLHRVGGIGR